MALAVCGGMSRRTSSLLLLLPVLFGASVAQAQLLSVNNETYLSVGPLVSVTRSAGESRLGLGVEATYNVFKETPEGITAGGAFVQAQAMEGKSLRLSAGFQATYMFVGIEMGLMHETASRTHVAATGVHFAPYLAFAFGSVGFRVSIPLTGTEAGGQGLSPRANESGFVLTAKLPIELDG
jgi:hypothetical protein